MCDLVAASELPHTIESLVIQSLAERVADRIRDWGVIADDTLETQDSHVVFGRAGGRPVVLKVIKRPGDEWHCGEMLEAFGGHGVVRVYEFVDGAVLLERLR